MKREMISKNMAAFQDSLAKVDDIYKINENYLYQAYCFIIERGLHVEFIEYSKAGLSENYYEKCFNLLSGDD